MVTGENPDTPIWSLCVTRTVSPGKAIIRFTSISLGLIGELLKRESVRLRNKELNGMDWSSDVLHSHYIVSPVLVT